jgi:hypothetical protein
MLVLGARGRRLLGAGIRLVLGALILWGLLWWLGPDWEEVGARLRLHWGYLAVALVGTGLATAFTAARWQLLNERMTQTRLPYATYFHYIALTRFLGQFSSMLLMDFVGRGVGLRTAGSRQNLGHLLTPVLLERLVDLLLPAALLVWAWAVHSTGMAMYAWLSLALFAVIFAVGIIPFVEPIAGLALTGYLRLKRWRGVLVEAEPVAISHATAAWISAHSMGRYAAISLQFFAMGAAAGAFIVPLDILSAMPFGQLSAIVSFTPGGLGIQDAGWTVGLGWLRVDEAVIALFLLAYRAIIIVNFGVLSLLTVPFGSRYVDRASTP